MANQTSHSQSRTISRSELCWLLGAVVFGAILRLSFPGRMAIEHFDEGVYASNFWFGAETGYSYPARYLYAPPLLPAAIEWTMTIASLCGIKPTGFVPMIPCLMAGIAMIPSLWWICRQWFGPTSGLVAAWLVSTSDFHVSYSRAALTDVPVCFFILWAVYFTSRAFLKCSSNAIRESGQRKGKSNLSPAFLPWDILLAGGFTGLAWWTKYNGWLPLAIGFTGGGLWQLLTPRAERQLYRVGFCWIQIAAVAFAVWSPVLWGLQKHGGYATVAANHKQYFVGFKGWGTSAVSQLYNVGYYEDPLDLLHRPFDRRIAQTNGSHQERFKFPYGHDGLNLSLYYHIVKAGQWRFLIPLMRKDIFNSVTPLFVPVMSLLISMTVCIRKLIRVRQASSLLFICLVFSWFAGMTIATPFYHPYPRLVLPWLCASWICLSLAAETWLDGKGRPTRERGSNHQLEAEKHPRSRVGLPFTSAQVSADLLPEPVSTGENFGPLIPSRWTKGVLTSLLLISALRLSCGSAVAWSDRSGIEKASQQFAATVKKETKLAGFPENEAIVYVFGEPGLLFGMKAEGLGYVGPVQGFGFTNSPVLRPTFLAFPPSENVESNAHRFQKEDGIFIPRSHLVFLDHNSWRISVGDQERRSETKLWRLYR